MKANLYRRAQAYGRNHPARNAARRGGRSPFSGTPNHKALFAVLAAALLFTFSGMAWDGLCWLVRAGRGSAHAAEGPLRVFLSPDTPTPVVCTGAPAVPFENEGYWYWNGYACRAVNCPGRQESAPALFPAVETEIDGHWTIVCPWCFEAGLGIGQPDPECVPEAQRRFQY